MPVTLHFNRDQERERLSQFFLADVWHFLSGRDLDSRPIIWTADPKDKEHPVKPFPTDKPYLRRWAARVVSKAPEDRFPLCDKPRQMIITTTTLLAIRWWAAKEEARKFYVSKVIREEAEDMLAEKIREVQERMPQWMQEHPVWWLSEKPKARIKFKNRSVIEAVAQNVAARAARGKMATTIFVDEAAYQPLFGEIWSAAEPMAMKLAGVSTPNNDGSQGAIAWNELLDEGLEQRNPFSDTDEELGLEPGLGPEEGPNPEWAHDGDVTAEDYD